MLPMVYIPSFVLLADCSDLQSLQLDYHISLTMTAQSEAPKTMGALASLPLAISVNSVKSPLLGEYLASIDKLLDI